MGSNFKKGKEFAAGEKDRWPKSNFFRRVIKLKNRKRRVKPNSELGPNPKELDLPSDVICAIICICAKKS